MLSRTLQHEFVEYIPAEPQQGVIYISIPFATAVHKCACGCGNEVVTPISPTDWKLTFDGESISLQPSIGNWSFPCRSHYWITRDRVQWAPRMSRSAIAAGRRRDRSAKDRYFDQDEAVTIEEAEPMTAPLGAAEPESFWRRLTKRFF